MSSKMMGGDPAVSFRRSVFLTAAIVTVLSAFDGLEGVHAQSVTGSGVTPGGIVSPNWSVGGNLQVGSPSPATGTLTIMGGGTVTNDTGVIGNSVSEQGTVTVSGHDNSGNASTWTNNGDLAVGQDGNGALIVNDGGKVSNGDSYIGAGAGSLGDVTISGRDINGHASTWTSTGQTLIGDSGTGTLHIEDGGSASSSLVVIGNASDGSGAVTVTGRDASGNASSLNVTNQIYVGANGVNNTLDILNGGLVNSGQSLIGYGNGSEGTVTVSGLSTNGNASAWNAANNIYVGFSGTGTLNVADGASVATSGAGGSAATVYIGYMNGGTGTVTLSSSTGNVSSLSATDSIVVGSQGNGTLNVEKGGFVSAASDVYIGRFGTASGTLHLNGDASGRGVLETGSVIKGAGSTAVLDLNGGILRANRDEANFLNGFTALTVAAEGAWFDTNAHDIAVGTDFSGSSSFNKLGLGQLTLTGDSSGFSGASTVSAGTLAVNGILGGDMLVDTAGRLAGTGSVGNVVNTGVVAPGYGNAMGTLTVHGNYVGTGGRIEIATVLGGDSSQTSRLAVNGTTSGSTQVDITNRGGLGAQTVNGIKIVDVMGASNGSFVLNGNYVFHGDPAVVAGAYAYRLYQGGVSTPTDGDWYLRSTLIDPGMSSGSGSSLNPPLYQPGVPLYEAYPQVMFALNSLPTLQQRVGNRYWEGDATAPATGDQPQHERSVFWARTEGSYARSTAPGSTTTLSNYSVGQWSARTGFDGLLYRNDDGIVVGGLTAHYGLATADVRSLYGDGRINTSGRGVGGTLTWYGATGFYVDSQAQVTFFDSQLKSDLIGRDMARDGGGLGYAFSVETGKRFGIGGPWALTPQAQLIYSAVEANFGDSFGAKVSIDGNDRLAGRLGLALDHQNIWRDDAGKLTRMNVYGVANAYYEFLGGTSVNVSGTHFTSETERVAGGFGIGGTYNWDNDKYSVYGEALIKTAFDDDYSIGGTAGFRMKW